MNMLKVGLLTYHFSDNFGALMQAYGLRTWFLSQGIRAEFLPYHPDYVEEGGSFDRPWSLSLWRKNVTILYMKLNYFRHRLFGDPEQRAAFEVFREKHLGISSPRCKTEDSLAQYVKDCDMLVCGSDQIWNPSVQRGLDPIYFLQISGSEGIFKVSYAPSFGRTDIEADYLPDLSRFLVGLDAISVREHSGLEILAQANITKACVVPDPTILHGDFSDLTGGGKVESEEEVFCYALRSDEIIRDVATYAAQQSGCLLHSARNPHQRWQDIGEGLSLGPIEWLRMFYRSRFVISNSFHGVALSLTLNKPFIAVALPSRKALLNARTLNLLESTGLIGRYVTNADPMVIGRLVQTPIDWNDVNTKLANLRNIAEDYLHSQIAKVQMSRL